MPQYVVLMNLTEAGAGELTDRPEAAREFADALRDGAADQGGQVVSLLWTSGEYDAVAVLEAPAERDMASIALGLARVGLVRTKTLSAYGHEEMGEIVGKLRGGKLRGGKLRGGKLRGGSADAGA